MIRALGLLRFKESLPSIQMIVQKNESHDAITTDAATAYVRLCRQSLSDASPVLELLEFSKWSVAYGAFEALGCDRMVPSGSDIERILSVSAPFGYEKGYGDVRYGIAVAAAGWPPGLTRAFLEKCLSSPDTGVVYAAENSLKGKYIKCR